MVRRQQQRALAQVEVQVEVGLGVRLQLRERGAQLQHDRLGFLAVRGQQHRQVAIVRQRAHHRAPAPCSAALQRALQRQVEAERAQGAAHAHALRAPDQLNHPVDGVEARAVNGVEEVEEGGELRTAQLHRVKHCLPRERVEAVDEVGLQDGVALLL